ncbi:transposase [Mesorhizobium sp.]|uniref:transposase n=1 Tax=Mesorhizobium sp. TaxID=1871066 RepID=UPI00257CC8FF|nr:transposase [Mesorhizobium sp.]
MTLEHAGGDLVAELCGAAPAEDRATVAGRVRQRRLWSCAEKRALVDLGSAAGSSVTEVAQAFGIAPSQLYAWRKQMAGGELDTDQAMATFARIRLSGPGRQDRRGLSEWHAIADRRDRRSDSAAYPTSCIPPCHRIRRPSWRAKCAIGSSDPPIALASVSRMESARMRASRVFKESGRRSAHRSSGRMIHLGI